MSSGHDASHAIERVRRCVVGPMRQGVADVQTNSHAQRRAGRPDLGGQSALREETERLNEDRGDLLAKQRKLAYEQEIITAREQGIALREEELRTQLRQSFQTEAASTGTPLEREGTAVLGTLGGQGSPEMTLPLERVAGDSAASLAAMVLETERHLEAQEGGNPEVPIAGSGS